MDENFPKRPRWLQFRLRTLLIAVLVLSLPLSWFGMSLEKARRQRKAVMRIEELGGGVVYDWECNLNPFFEPSPTRLRTWLGNDFFDKVVMVILYGPQVDDTELKYFADLTDLEELIFYETDVTDAGLENLKGLPNLETLYVGASPRITEAGLASMTNLETLGLDIRQFDPEVLERLQVALPNCRIAPAVWDSTGLPVEPGAHVDY